MTSKRIVFLDAETTGLSPHKSNHRVIDIACIEYLDGKPRGKVLQSILNGGGKRSAQPLVQRIQSVGTRMQVTTLLGCAS